ncbi:transposase [Larkinella punicea]|uniref:Transposase n=2 Tax=Larkinella punicea TaxID=2315727 RepID=A0A368JCN6_9BACT|nr:transposase [Larkinella punicea]RCR65428.1 transposase [Larkinella punicea]
MADHKPNLSHDVVSDFLRQERFTPADLWAIVKTRINDSESASILVDDSVQDKRYSNFIELVKKQYSGNEHGTLKGIGLVNFVHSIDNDGDFWPIDYRIFHPETDGKTKNDHFQEMFRRLITHKQLKASRIVFDSWYASVDNLKLIHRSGWTFFTTLKSNRLVSLHRDTGYQHLEMLIFDEHTLTTGLIVKLKEIPFKVKLFKIVAPNGDIDWVITNDLGVSVNLFVAELANDTRWQIETFHRSFKQLTGSERCQCRKARSQRNHLACCYQAWVALQVKAKQVGQTIYQLRTSLFADYLRHELAYPRVRAISL